MVFGMNNHGAMRLKIESNINGKTNVKNPPSKPCEISTSALATPVFAGSMSRRYQQESQQPGVLIAQFGIAALILLLHEGTIIGFAFSNGLNPSIPSLPIRRLSTIKVSTDWR